MTTHETPIIATYHGTSETRANGQTFKARGMSGVNGGIARQLIEAGESPKRKIEFHRNGTLCFSAKPLLFWADRQTNESIAQPAKIGKYLPMPEGLHK